MSPAGTRRDILAAMSDQPPELRDQDGVRSALRVGGGILVAVGGILAIAGRYDLTLSKSATNCAAIASENPNGGSITGGIAQAYVSAGTKLQVHTEYYSGGFALGDENFSVVVYC